MTEEEKETRARQREREEQNRKKDSHLKRMDEMKRLMINEIMRRGNSYDHLYFNCGMYDDEGGSNQEAA